MTGTKPLYDPGPDADEKVIEVRLSDVRDFLRQNRKRMLRWGAAGALLGAAYAFSLNNEYRSLVTVMPELQTKGPGSLSGLGSLAGLAGIDLNSVAGSTDAIRPDLYPNVLQSVPFALHLLKQPVYSRDLGKTLLLSHYFREQESRTLWGRLTSGFGGDGQPSLSDPGNFSQAIQITPEQEKQMQTVQRRVGTTFDKKSGIITIEATVPDPVVAATVARLSLEYLTNYVTSYRTEKTRNQAVFLTRRVAEARRRYQGAEYALESYRDRNRSLFTNVAKLEEQRLQADFLLTQSVYNDLSKQLEQVKIKVQEETPVFKVLEPPRVPLHKSGPKRTVIILLSLILGGLAGLAISVIRRLNARSSV